MSVSSPGFCASPRSPAQPAPPAAQPRPRRPAVHFTFAAKSPAQPAAAQEPPRPRPLRKECGGICEGWRLLLLPAPPSPGRAAAAGGGVGGGGGGGGGRGAGARPRGVTRVALPPLHLRLTDLQEGGTAGAGAPGAVPPRARAPARPRARRLREGVARRRAAFLRARRGSRDSTREPSREPSNEDIGPLNFSATARGRQRRTSNFLELPVLRSLKSTIKKKAHRTKQTSLKNRIYYSEEDAGLGSTLVEKLAKVPSSLPRLLNRRPPPPDGWTFCTRGVSLSPQASSSIHTRMYAARQPSTPTRIYSPRPFCKRDRDLAWALPKRATPAPQTAGFVCNGHPPGHKTQRHELAGCRAGRPSLLQPRGWPGAEQSSQRLDKIRAAQLGSRDADSKSKSCENLHVL
ncbi:Uncharacterized protein GBIM_18860 [Gryllus bimaculatus]|nr:Uncharacterized protein GBIM_18860 [Gryllus bimaculatus]